MRNAERIARLAALALTAAAALAGAGCGAAASSGSVTAAEESDYNCKPDKIFAASEAALAKEFQKTVPLAQTQAQGMVISEPAWYDKDGKPRGKQGTPEGLLQAGDIGFAARARLIDARKPVYQVKVDAVVRQHPGGSGEPVDVPDGDPRRPAWIKTRLDRVTLDIHERLSGCAVLHRDAVKTKQ